jgi:hypothetical protein
MLSLTLPRRSDVDYKNGRRPKSVPLAWRAIVTTHEGLIDRPRDATHPEKGWNERGNDQTGKPWVDAKTWAVARVLDDHMDNDGTCWVSYATIAAQARIGRTAAKEGVARLVGAGLLELRQRRIAPSQSGSNIFRALGVGPERPWGRADSAHTPGRSGPQSPHEVEGPSGHPGPRAGGPAGEHLCAGCGGPLGYMIEGNDDGNGALCLACFHGR